MLTEVPGDPTPAEAYECVYAYNQRDYIERQGFSVTANLAFRREVFDRVGPFAGIAVAEDMDWGHRATAMGVRIRYAPEMVVHHPARRSMAELRAKWDRNISHHFAVRAQGAAGKAKWVLTALALAASVPAELPRIATTDRLSRPARAAAGGARHGGAPALPRPGDARRPPRRPRRQPRVEPRLSRSLVR